MEELSVRETGVRACAFSSVDAAQVISPNFKASYRVPMPRGGTK